MTSRSISAFVVLVVAFSAPVRAHHSAAAFDTTKQVTVEGVVTKYDWRNPHIYLTVRASGAERGEVDQQIEAGASSVLLPLGLTQGAVTIGERVIVRGNPSRKGAGGTVLGLELVKEDGSVLPLNIRSTARRVAPEHATATSIAGTWLPPRERFFAYTGARPNWPFTEEGRKASAGYDTHNSAYKDCIPVTTPTLMLYPVVTVIENAGDVVKLRSDWMLSERSVYVDGRGHPVNGTPTLHGHSIGRWEGEALVVDTMQFASHSEGNNLGLPSSTRKHVVERFSLSDDRTRLVYEVTLEDPDYLIAPVTHRSEWDFRPDLAPTGMACDLDAARRFLAD